MIYALPAPERTCGYCRSTCASALLMCTCLEDCGSCCPAADDLKGVAHP